MARMSLSSRGFLARRRSALFPVACGPTPLTSGVRQPPHLFPKLLWPNRLVEDRVASAHAMVIPTSDGKGETFKISTILKGTITSLAACHFTLVVEDSFGTVSDPATVDVAIGADGPVVNPVENAEHDTREIHFRVERGGPVSIRVVDVMGRLARNVFEDSLPAGEWSKDWDGRDEQGTRVASGVYFVLVRTPGQGFNRKLVLVR